MLKTGFHRAALRSYTGFKSSPYTEGALFYGEALVDATVRDSIVSQAGEVTETLIEAACEPGSA
jgi:hypothetical protein